MPVALIVRLTVEEIVVVTATLIPVVTPGRVEELARTPVVVGKRSGGQRLGHACCADAGKTQSRGDCGRGCDSFQCHGPVVTPRSVRETPRMGVLAGDLLTMSLMLTGSPGGGALVRALTCATVIGWRRSASSLAP